MKHLSRTFVAALLALAMALALPASAETAAQDFTGTTLTVFNWYDYIDPTVIDMFEEETGATVNTSTSPPTRKCTPSSRLVPRTTTSSSPPTT